MLAVASNPISFFAQIMSEGAFTRWRPLILFPFRSQRLDGDFISLDPSREASLA
jgi:hypothetical protein